MGRLAEVPRLPVAARILLTSGAPAMVGCGCGLGSACYRPTPTPRRVARTLVAPGDHDGPPVASLKTQARAGSRHGAHHTKPQFIESQTFSVSRCRAQVGRGGAFLRLAGSRHLKPRRSERSLSVAARLPGCPVQIRESEPGLSDLMTSTADRIRDRLFLPFYRGVGGAIPRIRLLRPAVWGEEERKHDVR